MIHCQPLSAANRYTALRFTSLNYTQTHDLPLTTIMCCTAFHIISSFRHSYSHSMLRDTKKVEHKATTASIKSEKSQKKVRKNQKNEKTLRRPQRGSLFPPHKQSTYSPSLPHVKWQSDKKLFRPWVLTAVIS